MKDTSQVGRKKQEEQRKKQEEKRKQTVCLLGSPRRYFVGANVASATLETLAKRPNAVIERVTRAPHIALARPMRHEVRIATAMLSACSEDLLRKGLESRDVKMLRAAVAPFRWLASIRAATLAEDFGEPTAWQKDRS